MRLSDENIDQLFDASGRILAAGDGLHRTYWKRCHSRQKPNDVKLEMFALIRRSETIVELEKLARSQFDSLWQTYKAEIQKQPAAVRSRFHALTQASGKPTQIDWELPEQIVERKEGNGWKSHVYCDREGDFYAQLNNWEEMLLEELMKGKGFIGWLRNLPRRRWALCVPYEMAGAKPFYPDFVILRKAGSGVEVDLFEPHDDSRTDTWAKAKGLAVFADSHGLDFGRLVIARKKGEQFQFIDMNHRATREKARKMQSPNDLESLFG
jgi:type III restriction enzyme